MQYLFESWQDFAADIRAADHTLLLSDYDGTLTPIVSRPELAVLPSGVSEKIRALTGKPALSVGIVSGRSLAEIKKMVGIEGIYYAGNHGLEIEGPGLNYINPKAKAARLELKDIAGQLAERLGGTEGVIVEDKGLSLSLHYRLVKEGDLGRVEEVFRQIISPRVDEGKIRVTSGKKVWEVRPPIDWHKGKAVESIVAEARKVLGYEQILTIYLGDDTTDEDAFKVLQRPQGWGIFVGGENQSSSAAYFLKSTAEVETFMSRLLEME